MLSIEEGLSDCRNDAHQGAWISPLARLMSFKCNMLEHIRLQDDVVGVLVRKSDQRAGAADDTFARSNDSRGKANFTKRGERFLFRRIILNGPILRRHFGHFITGASAAPIV